MAITTGLYTVNKWNKPAFMQEKFNLFWPGGNLRGIDQSQLFGHQLGGGYNNIAPITPTAIPVPEMKLDTTGISQKMAAASSSATKDMASGLARGIGSSALNAGIGAASSIVGGLAQKAISGGYSTGGVGEGISSIGSTVGSAVGAVNPLVGAAITVGSNVVGGLVNRGFGIKENKENVAKINQNTDNMKAVKNTIGQASTVDDFLAMSSSMSGTSGFKAGDLYKNGWWTNKGTKKGKRLINAEKNAFAAQNAAAGYAANTVDQNQDEMVLRNLVAFGGPIDNYNSMGALEYGLMSDYVNAKKQKYENGSQALNLFAGMPSTMFAGGGKKETKKKTYSQVRHDPEETVTIVQTAGGPDYFETIPVGSADTLYTRYSPDGWFTTKTKARRRAGESASPEFLQLQREYREALDGSTEGNIGANMMRDFLRDKIGRDTRKKVSSGEPYIPLVRFDLGGVLQSHGGDFSDGLVTIGAGSSHELNPYDGVQVGVDQQGVPNLVEEGETIFDDYVFSNRILADDTTKQVFRLPKKKDITFADISKRLEKEIEERVNDPISKAGFKAQMQQLQEQQERQKQEMEAQRAKEAFEALTPEEQVAVMQQASQQEAMAEQAAQEQAVAEQQAMQQPSPEEMAVAQQQEAAAAQPEVVEQQPVMADGGELNLYGEGGTKNSGKFKDKKADNWGKYSTPGLKAFIEQYKAKLNMAPDEETRDAIRQEAIERFNAIQKSYASIYPKDTELEDVMFSDAVQNHQNLWNNSWGNTGFYSKDDKGNIINLIDEAIEKPKGADTTDRPESWRDGYWGPRTSLRNFGSTEYGDDKYYADITSAFKELGLNYAPNNEWKYGDNTLYGLSLIQKTEPESTRAADWTPTWQGGTPEVGQAVTPHTPQIALEEESGSQTPRIRAEWPRYAGLFGPAVGLGMMAAGVGKPDYSSLDAAVNTAGKAYLAGYKPLGNYLTYRPMDIWFEQNRLNANARATDRAIMDNAAPIGTKMAGLLASNYNNMIASGDLYRKALEYNDANREKVATFNRGTDQFNAEAFNRNSQFNAEALNRSSQFKNQLAMQTAQEKLNRDAGWYNSLYGNVGQLFKGLSDLGRENAQWNMVSRLAADTTNLGDSYTGETYLARRKKAKGGKVNKKKGFNL